MNRAVLQDRRLWMIGIPAVLVLAALVSLNHMAGAKRSALGQVTTAAEVDKNAAKIIRLRVQSGQAGALGNGDRPRFLGAASATECAEASKIPIRLVQQVSSPEPQRTRGGQVEHQERYTLQGVRLLQVAQFVDYAEQHYANLKCSNLVLTALEGKTPDSWSAVVTLKYTE